MIPVEKRTKQRIELFEALANESRCRIVEMFSGEREMCVSDLVDGLGLRTLPGWVIGLGVFCSEPIPSDSLGALSCERAFRSR